MSFFKTVFSKVATKKFKITHVVHLLLLNCTGLQGFCTQIALQVSISHDPAIKKLKLNIVCLPIRREIMGESNSWLTLKKTHWLCHENLH